MTNYSLIQKYIELQTGIMADSVTDLDFASLVYCKNDTEFYWNYALTNTVLSPAQVSAVEQRMNQSQRKPAFYFENTEKLSGLAVLLKQKGYKQASEKSWMFHSGAGIDETSFASVKKVETPEDLEIYLHTLNECYQKNDPTNPLGELGDYLTAARLAWDTHHANNRIEYFIVYKDTQPVAVSALTNGDGIGYISNVGSLMSVRGQGYGKLATLYSVSTSLKNKNTSHFLITEDGTNPNRFYTAIGFTTQFTARFMVKE